jgi:hypothetical protein
MCTLAPVCVCTHTHTTMDTPVCIHMHSHSAHGTLYAVAHVPVQMDPVDVYVKVCYILHVCVHSGQLSA